MKFMFWTWIAWGFVGCVLIFESCHGYTEADRQNAMITASFVWFTWFMMLVALFGVVEIGKHK